jgi:SNF2 family DNA or RNA helicase
MALLEINPSRWKTKPFDHQVEGVRFLANREYAANFDEMGAGKSKQTDDTACTLYDNDQIDTVVVVCPAQVLSTWKNPEWGEIAKHVWQPSWIGEYSPRHPTLFTPSQRESAKRLYWVVTNYEFIRNPTRLRQLTKQLKGRRIMGVLDESSYIKGPKSAQTEACFELRNYFKYSYILNGTPIANNCLDLWSQMTFLSPHTVGNRNYYAFRGRYVQLGGWNNKQVIGFSHTDELQRMLKPYIIRRLKKDCLDLPEKIDLPPAEVIMDAKTWRLYTEMRDYMITWLDEQTSAMTMHAVTKLLRLSQLTSGILGGIDPVLQDSDDNVAVVASHKASWLVSWLKERYAEDADFRCVVWCRFRREQALLANELRQLGYRVFRIYGGARVEREAAISEFTRGTGAAVLLGQPQAGGLGLNLVTAHHVVHLSSDYNLLVRKQADDRVHRTGQVHDCMYQDVLATGPAGQRTIDHTMYNARARKDNMANWTTSAWVTALKAERAEEPAEQLVTLF